MIKVGIFWVIGGTVYPYAEERSQSILNEREILSGKIDSKFEHLSKWDKELAKRFSAADFATYPRGRVMFDVKENRHIIYADKCVTEKNIEEIKKIFAVTKYTVERDDHYRCDKCMKHKHPPELFVQDQGNSYKVTVVSPDGVTKRTLDKSSYDEFAFEDILSETSTYESNGNFYFKFTVDEYPPSAFSLFFTDNTGVVPLYIPKDKISYKIIDGENKIGANLIELFQGGTKILVECGKELEPTKEGAALREKIVKKHYDACFISHYHGDHAGLLSEPINCDRIYMGEYTLKILETIGGICKENIDKTITFKANQEIDIDGLTVTPYLCDHSAYDSYMLYFRAKKNSILYTGDFRASGRKNFGALLSQLPKKVGTLICEGTNLQNDIPILTERNLENKLVDILGNTDKPVFVLQSATNIDRIVSVYRATIKSNRVFIMRLVQADICGLLPNIPQPNGFKRCFTYSEYPLTPEEHKAYVDKYKKRFIGRELISKMSNYVLEVTSKDLLYLQKLANMTDLKGAKLIYSTWGGYKEKEDMKAFLDGIKALGIEVIDLHASGHATAKDIDLLRKTVSADEYVTVHTTTNKR